MTGSTGELGGRAANRLARLGESQRLIVRDPARAPDHHGSTVIQASYADADAAWHTLFGVSTLFMVSGAEAPDRVDQHRTFVDAAVAAGVDHLVYTSFFGAAPDATFTLARDHFATEEHIKASGLRWTFLRDNLYLDVVPLLAGPDGVIREPAGDGRVAAGEMERVTDDVARLTGHPPMSLADLLRQTRAPST